MSNCDIITVTVITTNGAVQQPFEFSNFLFLRLSPSTVLELGLITIVIFCLMNIFPHFLYGPGADALALTVEFGGKLDANSSLEVLENEKRKTLCNLNGK